MSFKIFELRNKKRCKSILLIDGNEIETKIDADFSKINGPEIKYIILNCGKLEYVDVTACKNLIEFIKEFHFVDINV